MATQIDLLQYHVADLGDPGARAALFQDLVASGQGISPEALPALLDAISALLDSLEADLAAAERRQLGALRALETANYDGADLRAVIDRAATILET